MDLPVAERDVHLSITFSYGHLELNRVTRFCNQNEGVGSFHVDRWNDAGRHFLVSIQHNPDVTATMYEFSDVPQSAWTRVIRYDEVTFRLAEHVTEDQKVTFTTAGRLKVR
jgi:hypothetical protein